MTVQELRDVLNDLPPARDRDEVTVRVQRFALATDLPGAPLDTVSVEAFQIVLLTKS